mmetsp:Transcript_114/g.256  ORF Transcript_114/g.256 Transcript_114/m.256 type:complete len:104 (+) Transcript_114:52-363(+)
MNSLVLSCNFNMQFRTPGATWLTSKGQLQHWPLDAALRPIPTPMPTTGGGVPGPVQSNAMSKPRLESQYKIVVINRGSNEMEQSSGGMAPSNWVPPGCNNNHG